MDGRVAVRICDRSKGIDEGNEVRAGSEALNVIRSRATGMMHDAMSSPFDHPSLPRSSQ